MSKEAMNLALETLEVWKGYMPAVWDKTDEQAITALREALAEQPAQQEPVALMQEIDVLMLADSHGIDPSTKGLYNFYVDCISTSPLAQQEPVVFYRCNGCGHAYEQVHPTSCDCMEAGGFDRVEYYTSPPAQRTWVGLTDEEIYSVLENLQVMHHRPPTTDSRVIFARAIEAKLKEKNT